MPPKRSSTKDGKDLGEELVRRAREVARSGKSIRPGDDAFWEVVAPHLLKVTRLMSQVQDEVDEEIVVTNSATRECVVCQGPVFKRHKKGRWPIYCENCSLADR